MQALKNPTKDPGNAVIAHTLHWLAVLLEIDDGAPERVEAYRSAAHIIRGLDRQVAQLVAEAGSQSLINSGIDENVAATLSEWLRTGEMPLPRRDHGLWPALTRALCRTLGLPAPAPQRLARPGASRPVLVRRSKLQHGELERAVWESWT